MIPYFSIIIPVYNVEKYLDRCAMSLIAQTYGDFEAILVDDGSKDGSNAICRKWAEQDKRFRLIEKENAGLGFARNTGLDHATGSFVVYLDSDDYIVEDALEKIHRRLSETGADICCYGCMEKHEERMVYSEPPEKLEYNGEERLDYIHEILGPAPESKKFLYAGVSAWSSCVRRSIIEEYHIRFPSERECLCEDVFNSIRIFMHMQKMVIEPSCLYVYCFNGSDSLTMRYRPDRFEASLRMFDTLHQMMQENGYTDEVTNERISRALMQNLIVCMRQEVQYVRKNGLGSAMKRLAELCCNETVQSVMRTYPIGRMPGAQKLLFTAVKWKLVPVVFALAWMRYAR